MSIKITEEGKTLLEDAILQDKKVVFSQIELIADVEKSPTEMVKRVDVSKVSASDYNTITVQAQIDNDGFLDTYYFNRANVYADEVLFAYDDGINICIPAETTKVINDLEMMMKIDSAVADLKIIYEGYVLRKDFDDMESKIQKINTTIKDIEANAVTQNDCTDQVSWNSQIVKKEFLTIGNMAFFRATGGFSTSRGSIVLATIPQGYFPETTGNQSSYELMGVFTSAYDKERRNCYVTLNCLSGNVDLQINNNEAYSDTRADDNVQMIFYGFWKMNTESQGGTGGSISYREDIEKLRQSIQDSKKEIVKSGREIDSLKEDLGYVDTSLFMKEIIEIDYDSKYDGFAQADGLHTHTTRKGYRYNISGKQIIQVRGCAGGVIPLCVCFNSQDTVVQKFDAEKVFDNTVWQTITTPESTSYIYVNDNDNLGIVGCKAEKINKSYNARNHIEKAESDISDIKEDMIDKYSDVTSECSDWIYNTHYDASKTNGETPAERTDGNYSTRKIAVSKGEKYKLTTVIGYAKAYIMADANYDYLGNAYMYPQSSHAWKQEVVNITIPDNCKYLLFTAASEYVGIFKLERLSGLTFEAKEDYDVYFDLENWKERVSEEQAKNDFAWNAYDKGYVTFVMDDTRDQTGQFADLFISKNTPLCIGAIPSFLGNLVQNSVHGTTIKEVLNAVVKNGGEILAHGGGTFSTALTADSTDEDYYHAIVDSKKVLTKAGYEINGIITIGGGATAPDYEKCVKIMRPYYRYSDYYGHKTGVIQYDHERLGCYGLTLENLKAKVDECVAKKSWLVLFWHSTNEITLDNMSALIDYINTVNAEIITYKDLHDRFGSSKLEQRIKALESVN